MNHQQQQEEGQIDHLIQRLRLSEAQRGVPNSPDRVQQSHPRAWNPQQPQQTFNSPGPRTNQSHHQSHLPQMARGVSLMEYAKPSRSQPPSQQLPRQSTFPPASQRQHLHSISHRGGYHQAPRGQMSPAVPTLDIIIAQGTYLDRVAQEEIPKVAISSAELKGKEEFRIKLESLCKQAYHYSFPESPAVPRLIPYGSILSGFAVAGSDMDIICSWDGPTPDLGPEGIPRLFEGAILKAGIGARALTKTRVPILKICEQPSMDLFTALQESHDEWKNTVENPDGEDKQSKLGENLPLSEIATAGASTPSTDPANSSAPRSDSSSQQDADRSSIPPTDEKHGTSGTQQAKNQPREWRREKALGPLDFPKSGVGYQCDISFKSILGVYNTQLLRCYSACDPRVRDMVIFVKAWAKKRKINSGYHGTLCSYGWVLLVLHYLINVVKPPVLPNLQLEFGAGSQKVMQDGYNVSFANDETQLHHLAMQGRLTQNCEPLGALLRNFFHYYAHQGHRVISGGFRWKDDIISIRAPGGLLSKKSKGWTGATTSLINGVEVRQRYLLAVECPLETGHNVARTVHHFGVVAIRDELRKAWSRLESVGYGGLPPGSLFDEVEPDGPLAADEMESTPKPTDVSS